MPLTIPAVTVLVLVLWIVLWRLLLRRDYLLSAALLSAAILAAVMVRVAVLLPRLPAFIAVHFTGDGRANGWVAKSPVHVQTLAFLALGVWALFDLITLGVSRIPPGIATSGSVLQILQTLRSVIVIALAGTQFAIMAPQSSGHLPSPGWMILPVIFLVLGLLGSVVWMAWQQMGQARTLPSPPSTEVAASHYKARLFYIDRSDPRVLVERINGYGWTLNFAHSAAWLILALLLFLPVLPWLLGKL